MSDNVVFTKQYDKDIEALTIDRKEIWRYAGYLGNLDEIDEELKKQLESVIKELEGTFSYKVCFRRCEISWGNGMPELPFKHESKGLAKCLKGSSEAIIFAATVGLNIDRYIAKYQRFSPTKALLAQAYGAERIERLCDAFCKDIEEEVRRDNLNVTARFSPGYGDLPLDTQRELFTLLDCNRKIGISLNESLLMSPSKSVTAIFGIGKCTSKTKEHKCSECSKTDCEYRRI